MTKKIDFRFLIGGLVLLCVGIGTITGHTQKVIMFADPLNELFFASLTLMMSLFCLVASKK